MRPSAEELLLTTAELWAQRGTCSRLKVGAVVSRDNRILALGYNGSPAGMPHCVHEPGSQRPCHDAVHAEANVVAFAAKHGVSLDGTVLYVTAEPCGNCAKLIINSGIRKVVFGQYYDSAQAGPGRNLLTMAGVEVVYFPTIEVR